MGRVSKRRSVCQPVMAKQKAYKAGIYARLSSDQNAKKNESVEVQMAIAEKFVEEYNQKEKGERIEVAGRYIDLGKTGSNFSREGFERLMQDIRLGDINCVIVKDLSRFGRNYLEAGNYIEKIFPFLGVRFIAVSDGFDTGRTGNGNHQMASEIKNLVNDMYAKDSSKKAKLHLKQRREEGSYVGGLPPYGYIARWEGKRRILVPDENTREIVKFLYEKFVEIQSYTAVADELNRMRVNPPYIYHKTKEVFFQAVDTAFKGWDKGAVERILKNETYTGILVQGKTDYTAREEKNRIPKPREEWTITRDAHEPLVGEELYQRASKICQEIAARTALKKHPAKNNPAEENIFDGVLYCGVCGRKMTRKISIRQHKNGETARCVSYFCANSGQSKVDICPESNRISKTELTDILQPMLSMEFAVLLSKRKRYLDYGRERIAEGVKKLESEIQEADKKLLYFQEAESSMYMAYRSGEISQKEYVSFKMETEGKRQELQRQRETKGNEVQEQKQLAEKYQKAIRASLKLKNKKGLTKDLVEAFLSRVNVYPGKRVEVLYTFTAEHMEGIAG